MTGRPSDFTQVIADAICEQLSCGRSLRSICGDDTMPSQTTVFRWINSFPEFREQYARAREVQADTLFDEILDIADDSHNDWMERKGEDDAGWVANGDNIRRSQLRIDARKWMAGKLRPKVYGDKLDIDLNGKVDYVVSAKPMSEEEWLKSHGADE